MSGLGQRVRNTYASGAPANYVPGLGRGAVGFTTRSDIGPARAPSAPDGAALPGPPAAGRGAGRGAGFPSGAPGASGPGGAGRGSGTAGMGGFGREKDENEDFGDYSETNYDEFSGYSARGGLFQDTPYDEDDREADDVYEAIDERMDARRKRRREVRQLEELKRARQERPKISDQFADLKDSLKAMSDADWEQIPDIGDYSLKYKTNTALQKRNELFAPVPDSVLLSGANNTRGTLAGDGTITPAAGVDTPGGMASSMSGLAEARGAVLSLKLDKMSDSVSGQTVVDPKGYLTDLNSLKLTSDAEIGDIKKARLLLKSVTMTNPKHGPGWIAAARLEEVAGKMVQARKIIAQGCESCPTQEDVWLEAARLQNPENAKTILARAVRHVPKSVKIWLQAAQLENDDELKKLVMRRALEFIPNSVKLWKALIELEDVDGARVLLGRAVECVPQAVDLWLALARLETYDNAKKTLNKARAAIPTDPSIWITAAKLEEAQGKGLDMVTRIIQMAIKSLQKHQVVMRREAWLQEAEACEQADAPLTCTAVVHASLDIGVDPEDRKRTWMDDAENSMSRGALLTAKAIYAFALKVFPGKKSVWLRAIALEKQLQQKAKETSGESSDAAAAAASAVEQLLQKAVTSCPNAEILWLMAAKEVWLNGSVENSRLILRQAFSANPNSEPIWLAAVKLEWENGEIELARALLAKARAQAPSARVWMKSVLLEREQNSSPTTATDETREAEEKLVLEGAKRFPESAKLHMMAGQLYETLDPPVSYPRAKQMYREGVQRCPTSVPLWLLSSRLEEKLSGVTKARSVLELARLKIPKNDVLWLEATRLESRHGNTKGQEMLLAKALQECPESGILLAESIDIAPRAQQKRASFTALKKKDNDPAVCLSVAKLFWHERKYSKARKWLERTVQLDADFGDGWAFYYLFERQHGGKDSASDKILARCVSAEPRHGEKWTSVSKQTAHRRKSTAELLKLVSTTLPFFADKA
jgi:pre-mRNA-processing factor 6